MIPRRSKHLNPPLRRYNQPPTRLETIGKILTLVGVIVVFVGVWVATP